MKIVGHEEIRKKLCNIVESEKVGHAYLFTGKSGIGKRLVAIEFAKNVMCQNRKNGICCDTCVACKTFENNADFMMIEPENNVIKVDVIRNFENEVYLKPTISAQKCFIINDADCMNESAQNALLKILEEPPLYATIILIATNKERLLNTIKSRVVEIRFNGLSEEEMVSILGHDVSPAIISYARGSVQKAYALLKENDITVANHLVEALKTKDFLAINKKFDALKSDKNLKQNISNLLESMAFIYYKDLKENVKETVNAIGIINDTNRDIKNNANLDLAIDYMIIRFCFED